MKGKSLQRSIDAYRAWYRLTRSWSVLQVVLFALFAALALYILLDKVVFFSPVGYDFVALLAGTASVVVLLVSYALLSASPSRVSYLIDRHPEVRGGG